MKALPGVGSFALTTCLLAGLMLAPARAEPLDGNPDRGLEIYAAYCAACHGFEGRGDGPMAARLEREGFPPLDLSQARWEDEELARRIREGHSERYMPAWEGSLTEGQLTDLVAFIRELRSTLPPTTPPVWDAAETFERGRIQYGFRCLACHGEDGRGGGPLMLMSGARAQDLTSGVLRDYTDKELGLVIIGELGHENYNDGLWKAPLELPALDALVFFLRGLSFQRPPEP